MNELNFTETQSIENISKRKGIMKTEDLIQVVYKVTIIIIIVKTSV